MNATTEIESDAPTAAPSASQLPEDLFEDPRWQAALETEVQARFAYDGRFL